MHRLCKVLVERQMTGTGMRHASVWEAYIAYRIHLIEKTPLHKTLKMHLNNVAKVEKFEEY